MQWEQLLSLKRQGDKHKRLRKEEDERREEEEDNDCSNSPFLD